MVPRPASRAALEIVVVLLVLAVILGLRLWHLEADPPSNLAVSTSIYTDAPAYTMFARMYVETGEISPFDDHRYPFFIKSTVTLVAIAVFKLFGIGLWQSNLVGVLFSIGALLLMFLFVRRVAGRLAGVLFLCLIGINYNLLFFGKMPFLEHAMQFWASLALVLLVYSERYWSYILAGMALAVGVLFGKIIGLIYLFPFACFLAYRAVYESPDRECRRWLPTALFVTGFAGVALFWFLYGYLPASEQVTGYVGEHTVGYYGAPEALQSVGGFVDAMVTFGVKSRLFPRMTVIALLGCGLVGMVLYHATSRRSWRSGFGGFGSGHLFVVAGIIGFFASLMIWNYRPLRYELSLIYLFGAAAAIVLSKMWTQSHAPAGERPSWLFYPLFYPVMLVAVSQLLSGVARIAGETYVFEDNPVAALIVAAVITLLSGLVAGRQAKSLLHRMPVLARVLVLAIVVGVAGRCLADYVDWRSRTTYTLRDNARDVDQSLTGGAVLSGPYGPAMALAGGLDAVVHMFGVTAADSGFFERFPITHLLLDEANEELARADYPILMAQANHVCTYHVGLEKVRMFRIAGHTGNARADAYVPSEIERAVGLRNEAKAAEAVSLAQDFCKKHPDNIVANLLVADILEQNGHFHMAVEYLKKAVEFTPTNYNLNALLGSLYKRRYESAGEPQYRTLGIKYLREAVRLAPSVTKMRHTLEELEANTIGQP